MFKYGLMKSYLKSKDDNLVPEIIDSLYSYYNNVFKDEIDREDLVQDAVVNFYEKLMSEKITESNYAFYLWSSGERVKVKLQTSKNRDIKIDEALSLDMPLHFYSIYNGERGYHASLEDSLVVDDILKLLESLLTFKEYDILYAVSITEKWTTRDAGKYYGVTYKRILQILEKIRKKYKEYFIKEGYLDEN